MTFALSRHFAVSRCERKIAQHLTLKPLDFYPNICVK